MSYVPGLMKTSWLLPLVLGMTLAIGCDRRIEEFDPEETVEAPDLKRIFPAGAKVVADRERESGGEVPVGPPGGRNTAPAAAATGAPITGTLELSAELEGSVPSGGVLFVVARSPQGGPPVAVKRVQSPTFPMDFEVGPDDRMIQAIPFQGPLILSARVDADGNATTREPGDLAGAAEAPVEPGATGIRIQINEKL